MRCGSVAADAPIDWLMRFAFLDAVHAKHLPPGPESWKAFACVANAARPISDRNPTLPIKNLPCYDPVQGPCNRRFHRLHISVQ